MRGSSVTNAVLRTDGGARGNPGHAGAGFVIQVNGETVCAAGRYLGLCTNNVAEYEALIWGLENARSLGYDSVSVFSDSELLVKQLKGVYRVKHPGLKPLFLRSLELLRQFASFEIQHVRREQNAEADALANQAMDEMRTVGNPSCGPGLDAISGTLF